MIEKHENNKRRALDVKARRLFCVVLAVSAHGSSNVSYFFLRLP